MLSSMVAECPCKEKAVTHPLDAIGGVDGVHRATAARWLERARERLVALTLAELMRVHGISEEEARSLVAGGLSGVGSMLFASWK